jgi:hypothetical protein
MQVLSSSATYYVYTVRAVGRNFPEVFSWYTAWCYSTKQKCQLCSLLIFANEKSCPLQIIRRPSQNQSKDPVPCPFSTNQKRYRKTGLVLSTNKRFQSPTPINLSCPILKKKKSCLLIFSTNKIFQPLLPNQ